MIRLAVAGMAHPHVTYVLSELPHRPELRLVAVSDPDPDNVAAYAESIGDVPAYADHQEMLARHEVDVVSVNGVYIDRAVAVVDALHAGAHVVVDKPLCTSLEQLSTIETAAAATGRLVSLVFEKRAHPVTRAARRLVAAGTLGDLALITSTGPHPLRHLTRPSWFFTADYGGVLADLAVHDVDVALALTGARDGIVVGTCGKRAYPQYPEFSDHGAMLLAAGEVMATIDAHWLAPESGKGRYEMRLVGTQGTAEMRWTEGELGVATHDRDAWLEPLPPKHRPVENFFGALLAGQRPEVGTAESVDATRIALLAQRSADHGGAVEHWKI